MGYSQKRVDSILSEEFMSRDRSLAHSVGITALDNAHSLFIYRKLLDSYENCSSGNSSFLNLFTVFFHDLMRILSLFALRKNEINAGLQNRQLKDRHLPEFPYVSYPDIEYGLNVANKKIEPNAFHLSRKMILAQAISQILNVLRSRRRKVIVTDPAINLRWLYVRLITSGIRIISPPETKIHIPFLDDQLLELYASVKEIFSTLELDGSPDDMFSLLKEHIISYYNHSPQNSLPASLVVTGTLLDIRNRILAANARAQGIKVITVSHGDCDGVLDEPVFGYGDHSYSSTIIGYGEAGKKTLRKSHYSKGLFDSPAYISANSSIIDKINSGKNIEPLDLHNGKRIMYVPTGYTGLTNRYGPFRDLPDTLYMRWHEQLINAFPELIFKTHPKGYGYLPRNVKHIITKDFRHSHSSADIYIFDYLSTAFAIAAATSKPIIYFNIGLRNFTEFGRHRVMQRCHWIDVDPNDPGNLNQKVLLTADKVCTNNFTESFSIAKSGDTVQRERVLISLIEEAFR